MKLENWRAAESVTRTDSSRSSYGSGVSTGTRPTARRLFIGRVRCNSPSGGPGCPALDQHYFPPNRQGTQAEDWQNAGKAQIKPQREFSLQSHKIQYTSCWWFKYL